MKKFLILLTCSYFLFNISAQDIIYKTNGSEIQSIVLEIMQDVVKYKNFDQPEGPIRNINISEIFMIIYKDGTKEVFKGKSNAYEDANEHISNPEEGINSNTAERTRATAEEANAVENDNTIRDIRDDNVYKVVQLGDQIWMAENLRATQLNDGTPIPLITESSDWKFITSPAYCYNFGHFNDHGALYNFYAVETGKLCPVNWHVPNDQEWDILVEFLGGKGIAGRTLQDENGFNALKAGTRYHGNFMQIDEVGTWWSFADGHFIFIMGSYKSVYYKSMGSSISDGRSVRCVKD